MPHIQLTCSDTSANRRSEAIRQRLHFCGRVGMPVGERCDQPLQLKQFTVQS
ncbi:hypothetical protein BC832DRAFT_561551 [Gaertneriomyces semiglobifer]|nr:hypothetical protein BC832DRAFT_566522 [Gaertneriomyces semiglobifer]KAI9002419.1 hypothetical protein BC832DRAFT_561551 [Gaertneriomyces semiglobifer]